MGTPRAIPGLADEIFEGYPAPTLIVDRDVQLLLLNRAARQMLAAESNPGQLLLKHAGEAVGCVHAQEPGGCGRQRPCQECVIRRSVSAALTTGTVHRSKASLRLRQEGGEAAVCLLVSASPLHHAGEELVLLTLEDITDVERSEGRFHALIEKVTDIILVFDREAAIRFWSPGASETLGWTANEVLGRQGSELVHPGDATRVLRAWRRMQAAPGSTTRVALRLLHRDGSWRQVESVARNLLDDPAVRGVVVNARDVTEWRCMEEQVQQAQKLDSIGRLAGGVAHDFNNLLTVILSCAEALRTGLAARLAPDPEDVEEILAAGERARDLTRQLLSFARRQVIAPVALDMNKVVRGSERLLRRLLGEDIELQVKLQPALWPVRCDPGQLEQVVMNLSVNARDAMPGGGTLTLETANVLLAEGADGRAPRASPGEYVRLAVRDSGTGLSEEARAHLFEPFFTTKPAGRGTGLGLATVYGIVRQSGGHIRAESERDRGTLFEVFLPHAPELAVAAAAPIPAATARGAETVLVVEDDPLVRSVTVKILRGGGFRVLVAAGGSDALELARREPTPDLVVTDVVMPGLDGRSLVERLRRQHAGLRALYVSGYPQDTIARRGVLDSGIQFLPKPFTAASLLARVRAVLDSRP